MAEYNGTIDLISGIRPKNNGKFPLVEAKDVQMPDGTRLSDFNPETSTPVFNLVDIGLPNVPYGHTVMVIPDESVLTELSETLAKGEVGFIFNCEKEDGSVTSYSITMNPQTIGGITTCFKVVAYNDGKLDYVVVAIVGTAIGVGISNVALGKTEAPSFDLSALGLPNVPYGDTSGVYLEADTTEIMEALAKGEVTFAYTAAVGGSTTSLAVTVNPILAGGRYICCTYAPMVSELDVIRFIIMEGVIYAVALPVELGGEEVATSIDLSALDSGTIVETYADGTTKTITLEYDEDGNPIKITDGDGNVTELTW